MSGATIASLPRVSAAQLRGLITTPATAQSLAIIDVRDSDYIGGHIASSTNVPSSTHDVALPELVRKLANKKVVVFHCMLSQVRGPSAALKYARERERLLKKKTIVEKVVDGAKTDSIEAEAPDGEKFKAEDGAQEVMVLQGGFEGWVQSGYGNDETLTEEFVKDLWEME